MNSLIRQKPPQRAHHGQPANPGIENADRLFARLHQLAVWMAAEGVCAGLAGGEDDWPNDSVIE